MQVKYTEGEVEAEERVMEGEQKMERESWRRRARVGEKGKEGPKMG